MLIVRAFLVEKQTVRLVYVFFFPQLADTFLSLWQDQLLTFLKFWAQMIGLMADNQCRVSCAVKFVSQEYISLWVQLKN